MEPVGQGGILAAVIAAIAGLSEPPPASVPVNAAAPPDFRPLRLEVPGSSARVHPAQIAAVARVDTGPFPALSISFGPEMGRWIATTTQEHLGEPMVLSLCGKDLFAPVIREAITGGEVMISGSFDAAELDAIMFVVAGRVDCDGNPLAGPAPAVSGGRAGSHRGD